MGFGFFVLQVEEDACSCLITFPFMLSLCASLQLFARFQHLSIWGYVCRCDLYSFIIISWKYYLIAYGFKICYIYNNYYLTYDLYVMARLVEGERFFALNWFARLNKDVYKLSFFLIDYMEKKVRGYHLRRSRTIFSYNILSFYIIINDQFIPLAFICISKGSS